LFSSLLFSSCALILESTFLRISAVSRISFLKFHSFHIL
jgi:hypothetical protein